MKYDDYPALFKAADTASNNFQRHFLQLIKAEYALLISAAFISVVGISGAGWHAFLAGVLLLSCATLLIRSIWKPEQNWYKARALAESVKTLTWRYAMVAYPFNRATAVENDLELRENLSRLLKMNADLVAQLPGDASADDQVTNVMDHLRSLPLSDRRQYYQENRIQEQRKWYRAKSTENKKIARRWVVVSIIGYCVAIVLSLARIVLPDWHFWQIEPLIVVASSILGWVQIKKFNELAASYAVTAQEIGMINITLSNADSVRSFSDFVNEAEGAFSREHTSWIARQAN